ETHRAAWRHGCAAGWAAALLSPGAPEVSGRSARLAADIPKRAPAQDDWWWAASRVARRTLPKAVRPHPASGFARARSRIRIPIAHRVPRTIPRSAVTRRSARIPQWARRPALALRPVRIARSTLFRGLLRA